MIFSMRGCWGERATKVAPKMVSILVVKTVNFSWRSGTGKMTSAPRLLPIQFFCIKRTFSGQRFSSLCPSRSSSA